MLKDFIRLTKLFDEAHPSVLATPEFDLYASVLNQVFVDAMSNNNHLSKSAISYVDTEDCKFICETMGVEHQMFKQKFTDIVKNNNIKGRYL